jgi:hypothetical protein
MILSEDRINHLSHLILDGLKKEADLLLEESKVLREIKRLIAQELKKEEEMDAAVRAKLTSYSRPIYEGSPEWEVLYKKFLAEEIHKHSKHA